MDPEPSSLFIPLVASLDSFTILKFILLFLLLIGSALISGAEVAYFSFTPTDLKEVQEEKTASANIIFKLLTRPKKFLATLLIANNTINIAVVLLFDTLNPLLFGTIETEWIRFTLEVGLVTFLILMFGEILPKVYANRNKRAFAGFMARPLNVIDFLCTPLSVPMRNATLFFHKKFGKQKTSFSVDQLSHALELTSEEDTTKEEHKILQGIVSFGNTETKQVMRPRIDIFAVSEDTKFSEVLEEVIQNGYSRIPVYKENIDQVTGVLFVKDLLPHLDKKSFDWVSIMRKPYFVPENKKLDDLLLEFQDKKNHLAIVVDEYGGTSGLVTLEDIIEEIVGDISDEFDDEDIIYSMLDETTFIFEGKTALKDFYRVIKIEDDSVFEEQKGEAETIAGFVLEIAGNFPKKGEIIIFRNYTFTVEALDKKRIKQIKVAIGPEVDEE
ncbi:gliding motility-associated protein GldE [Pustulibacterium marinum]|uniref:Gliding motility-associated protein GldE n=1 Tax=Pustulibacterium marinum TaxID=1224947 RepID=A0A1I7HCQ8_9FLAO|nr:gliding motility-associated protein GldE [Pustulibacterium marinum]SFU58451.1 gliding motility-associated protein GldE [Pustulibacterium marinum]